MTTNSEKLSLKWNDFENNLSSAFTELRHDKELFDVTLVCDKNQIEAHKVVISACSPFFRRILKRSPHSHPLLYLKGVPFTDLESVLNFMYQGEVSISQDHLNSFLATAEELEVKGLTEGSGGAGSCTSAGRGNPNHETSHGTQFRAAMKPQSFVSAETGDSDIMEIAPVKMEASFSSVVVVDHQEEGYEFQDQDQEGFHYEDYNSYVSENIGLDQDIESQICAKMTKEDGIWSCRECIYTSRTKGHVYEHIEAKHVHHGGYICPKCSKLLKTRASLRMHSKHYHSTMK